MSVCHHSVVCLQLVNMHYAWVTYVLGLSYSCVTLVLRLRYVALRLCYACVTLVLRLGYTWVTLHLGYTRVKLGLRLLYACEFNINIKLSRQLSVFHQSHVSLMSVCHHSVVCLQ